jgi:hypothetical protein
MAVARTKAEEDRRAALAGHGVSRVGMCQIYVAFNFPFLQRPSLLIGICESVAGAPLIADTEAARGKRHRYRSHQLLDEAPPSSSRCLRIRPHGHGSKHQIAHRPAHRPESAAGLVNKGRTRSSQACKSLKFELLGWIRLKAMLKAPGTTKSKQCCSLGTTARKAHIRQTHRIPKAHETIHFI